MAFNVLVVEDSAVMRAMIIKTLRLSRLPVGEVWEAANGEEGLRRMREHWVDVVLADVNMPVMDGETMVDRMRQDPLLKGVPVIIVSTESSQSRIGMLVEKTSGFVHKPFAPEELRKIILDITGASDESGTDTGTLQGIGQDF